VDISQGRIVIEPVPQFPERTPRVPCNGKKVFPKRKPKTTAVNDYCGLLLSSRIAQWCYAFLCIPFNYSANLP
jgi:hypothetical protein